MVSLATSRDRAAWLSADHGSAIVPAGSARACRRTGRSHLPPDFPAFRASEMPGRTPKLIHMFGVAKESAKLYNNKATQVNNPAVPGNARSSLSLSTLLERHRATRARRKVKFSRFQQQRIYKFRIGIKLIRRLS
jgi:hypothetical protein